MWRFVSKTIIDFCSMQADIIRRYRKPGDFITTNGMFGHIDNVRMTEEALDFITYDNYPNFAYSLDVETETADPLLDRLNSLQLSKVRSVSPNFGIMEQQSGGGGWQTRMAQPAPKPGQMRLWALQAIAHGADYVSFFRWRTCNVGMELYWHGILDYDNRDNLRLREVQQIHGDMEKLAQVAGAAYRANVALCYDDATDWDAEGDIAHGAMSRESVRNWFAACQYAHVPADFLCLGTGFSLERLQQYRLAVLPHIALLSEPVCEVLKAYVEQGGHVIFGAHTGYKDEFGRCPMRPIPGAAAELAGGTAVEYTLLPKKQSNHATLFGKRVSLPVFNEVLQAEDGEVLALYTEDYYQGRPAILRKRTGEGETLYVGSAFSEELAAELLRYEGLYESGCLELELPEKVELAVREKDGRNYHFLLNFSTETQTIVCKREFDDLLGGRISKGLHSLPPYGVMVLL